MRTEYRYIRWSSDICGGSSDICGTLSRAIINLWGQEEVTAAKKGVTVVEGSEFRKLAVPAVLLLVYP